MKSDIFKQLSKSKKPLDVLRVKDYWYFYNEKISNVDFNDFLLLNDLKHSIDMELMIAGFSGSDNTTVGFVLPLHLSSPDGIALIIEAYRQQGFYVQISLTHLGGEVEYTLDFRMEVQN